ncbi:MAG TPA: LysR family transcriptional regulator, partial [Candidatus Eubacterium avistercoris]|nr:LysR family transcriptional regulator [Candidatus Eubacterium avistercoris]
MNFQQLEYFLSLCQNMNYSETARRLYVSQPTVSKQIAALESELNMKLFKRSSNGLALTAEGQIMQNAFEHAIHIINAAKEDALHLSVQKSRTIHFGILEGADIVSPIMGSLAELEKQIENTNFSFDFLNHGTLNHKLEYNEIDLAVTLLEEVLA